MVVSLFGGAIRLAEESCMHGACFVVDIPLRVRGLAAYFFLLLFLLAHHPLDW